MRTRPVRHRAAAVQPARAGERARAAAARGGARAGGDRHAAVRRRRRCCGARRRRRSSSRCASSASRRGRRRCSSGCCRTSGWTSRSRRRATPRTRARTRQPARRRGSGRRSARSWRGWRGEARRVAHRLRRRSSSTSCVERWGEHEREIVEHPGAVAIVAVDADDRIVLVRQLREPARKELLELPAGTVDEGEEPLATAQRELAEETGLRGGEWRHVVVVLDDARLLPRADAPVLRRGRRGGRAAAWRTTSRSSSCAIPRRGARVAPRRARRREDAGRAVALPARPRALNACRPTGHPEPTTHCDRIRERVTRSVPKCVPSSPRRYKVRAL